MVHSLVESFLGVFVHAEVPILCVLESILDGRVPDHDAAEVLLDDGIGQLRDDLRFCRTLGSENDLVLGNSGLDWKSLKSRVRFNNY